MMNTFRKNGGFTLMELLVTIVTASIVTLAATTILLLGIRINRQSIDTASRQTTTRILLTTLEKLATEGTIKEVRSDSDSWEIIGGEGNQTLFSYDSASQTIYTGDSTGAPLLEKLESSLVRLDGNLLTVSVQTEDGYFNSSIYCRTAISGGANVESEAGDVGLDADGEKEEFIGNGQIDSSVQGTDSAAQRANFLKALASQYSRKTVDNIEIYNTGTIIGVENDGKYYSEWYIEGYGEDKPGWNPQTPWCACFISWGLNQAIGETAPRYANVDVFMRNLQNGSVGKWQDSAFYNGTYIPEAGDLIFFDWTINAARNPEHVGAVITIIDNYVYTIEGNSAGRVAVRKYGLNDPRIIGYGILEWKS